MSPASVLENPISATEESIDCLSVLTHHVLDGTGKPRHPEFAGAEVQLVHVVESERHVELEAGLRLDRHFELGDAAIGLDPHLEPAVGRTDTLEQPLGNLARLHRHFTPTHAGALELRGNARNAASP
ncbi:MAG: hypothetical protein IPN32_34315 [Deltaproteobacteria bacterium]|nr:hypothetical protein [Deltaproteobacteria bacterium]